MINNDNITSAENGVESNAAERKNVLQCTWSVLTYSMTSDLRGKGDSQYTVKYWEYVRILRRVAPHGRM